MNIDWNCKSAEGKDYCLYHNESNFIFCRQKPTNDGECWLVGLEPFVRDFTLHERPKAEQMKETIYTKEMHEAGELPKVGVKVELCGVVEVSKAWFDIYTHGRLNLWRNGDILNVIAKVVMGSVEVVVVQNTRNDQVSTILPHCYKPLDTRTDREKAIDDLVRLVTTNTEFSKSYASDLFDYIKLGKIHGITFTGDK